MCDLLSVVLLNWNGGDVLLQCIASVVEHASDLRPVFWLVDNGSTDGSRESVIAKFPEVNVIRNTENIGIARGRNQALERVTTRYVLCLDSDTIVLPGTLQTMVTFLMTHPDVGVVGCRLIDRYGKRQPFLASFPTVASHAMHWLGVNWLFPHAHWIPNHHELLAEPKQPARVPWVSGACNLTRTSILFRTGLRNPRIFYADDMEWCYRVGRAGWKIYYLPQVEVIHLGGASGVLWTHHITKALEDTFYFIEATRGRTARRLVKALAVCGLAGRVALFRLASSLLRRPKMHAKAIWFQRLLLACFGQVSALRPPPGAEKSHDWVR